MAVATPIFEALGKLKTANRRHDQALSKAMLESALYKKLSDVQASQFEDHLVASGVTIRHGFHCIVLQAEEADSSVLDALEDIVASVSQRLPSVYSRRQDQLVLVVPSDRASISHLRSVFGTQRFERVRTGIGRAVSSAHDLSVSYRDAVIVLRYLDQEDVGAALTFEDLDLASQLLAEVPPDRVASKVKVMTDLLLSNPIQLEALRAYFATCQNVQTAAKLIFVHPNTLRYRLERFEMALGRSLRDPAIIASLHYVLSLMQDRTSENSVSDSGQVPRTGTA
ncbi:helix-turn-helix domain-containing protein (plasmid) [Rhodococcus opacus]|uniref:PucR family transcriptional regulator n=1 Tax=Rhodococcus opacus TaxID=37919 RepID=UPI0034D2A705